MSDEPVGTIPQGEPGQQAGPIEGGTPQGVQEPQAQDLGGVPPAIPPKFEGKSAEEIAQAYQELERKLGEQAQELGELRARVPQYPPPNPYGYPPPPGYQPGPQFQQAPPERAPIKWNWENPVDTITQVVRQEILPLVTNYQQNTAKNLSSATLSAAKAERPDLFEGGVEPQVRSFMENMIDQGVLKPESALNTGTWQMAAYTLQGMKTGFRAPRPAGPPINPVQTVRTETPGYRPPFAGAPLPQLSERDRRMSAAMGISEEQAQKNLAGRK